MALRFPPGAQLRLGRANDLALAQAWLIADFGLPSRVVGTLHHWMSWFSEGAVGPTRLCSLLTLPHRSRIRGVLHQKKELGIFLGDSGAECRPARHFFFFLNLETPSPAKVFRGESRIRGGAKRENATLSALLCAAHWRV